MFYHIFITKNNDISVIQFIPDPNMDIKKALDIKLKELKEKDSDF